MHDCPFRWIKGNYSYTFNVRARLQEAKSKVTHFPVSSPSATTLTRNKAQIKESSSGFFSVTRQQQREKVAMNAVGML